MLRLVPITFFVLILLNFKATGQLSPAPDFNITFEPITNVVPGLHSCAIAESGSKWLLIGGRTNGLHGFSSNDGFDPQYANNNILVIDTVNWQSWSSSLSALPLLVADPLRSTNMQYIQDGNSLYMIGGFGWDSTQNRFVTFSTLTAIDVDNMIQAVVTAGNISPWIKQVSDTNLTICGGEMEKLSGEFYLFGGHNFQGRYTDPPTPLFTQKYSNKLKKFQIDNSGSALSVANFSYSTDTLNFHRRDLILSPGKKANGEDYLQVLGGVFKYNSNTPYREPIVIDSSGLSINFSFQQTMNQYTCAVIPMFDSISKKMHYVLPGGMSLYDYNESTSTLIYDSLVPFVNDVSVITRDSAGNYSESLMNYSFKGFLGTNAHFFPSASLPVYGNDVVKLASLPQGQKIHAGYFYGGIRGTAGNLAPSHVNDTVYRVFIQRTGSTGINDKMSYRLFSIFPNPANNYFAVELDSKIDQEIFLKILDTQGRITKETSFHAIKKGMNRVLIHTHDLDKGIYFLQVSNGRSSIVRKLLVIH